MAYIVLQPVTDCELDKQSPTYSIAREGPASFANVDSFYICQQYHDTFGPTYACYQWHLKFDTSFLGAGAIINSADLWLAPLQGNGGNGLIYEVRKWSWAGASPAGTDFLPGSQMAAQPLMAYWYESAWVASVRVKCQNEGMIANINKTSPTILVVHDSRQRLNSPPPPPADSTNLYVSSGNPSFRTEGDYRIPQLIIDYTPSPAGTGGTITEFRRAQDHL